MFSLFSVFFLDWTNGLLNICIQQEKMEKLAWIFGWYCDSGNVCPFYFMFRHPIAGPLPTIKGQKERHHQILCLLWFSENTFTKWWVEGCIVDHQWLLVEWFAIFKKNHEVWMARTLKNIIWLLKCFVGWEAFDPVYKGPALRIFRSYTQIRDMYSMVLKGLNWLRAMWWDQRRKDERKLQRSDK